MSLVPITIVNMPTSKYTLKSPYSMIPEYITIHNTANDASAMSEISYMIGNNLSTSFHFAVDDTRAVQGLPLNRNGWHAGDGKGAGNLKSIGIEICYSKSGGAKFKKAEQNGAKLTAMLLNDYGWGVDRVKKHQDWSGKYCPHRTLSETGWNNFIKMVQTELNGLKNVEYSKTPIMGKSEVTARQMAKFLLDKNPQPKINEKDTVKFCQYYLDEGAKEGIRGDIAFCQSIHETGWFNYGGLVLPEQNNYAGIGATNNSKVGKGAWFDTPQLGVRAQIHHLKAYASKDEIKNPLSPRYHIVKQVHGLGSAPYWEELSGKWAVPGFLQTKYKSLLDALIAGETYGHSILKVFNELKKVKVDEIVEDKEVMLERAILIGSLTDFPSAEPVAKKEQAPIYLQDTEIKAKHVIVIGGKVPEGYKGEVTNLSGKNRFETALNVNNYLEGEKK